MENFDKIERYLKQEMPDSERAAFEKEVAENPALADELLLQRVEEEAIDLMIEDNLLAKVRIIAEEDKKAKREQEAKVKPLKGTRWFPLLIAASVLLVAGFFILNLFNNGPDYSQMATDTLNKNRPNLSGSMGINETDASKEKEANYDMILMEGNAKKIEEVITYYTPQNNSNGSYKLGQAYLIKKDFAKAIESFQRYRKSTTDTDFYRQQTDFYIALAYLGAGNVSAAKSELEKIEAAPSHVFNGNKDVKALLQDLK